MKILVAGAQGQLARALAEAAPFYAAHAILARGRPALDLQDRSTIARALAETTPDIVVNAAAYTAVDKAENDAATAFAISREGAAALAEAAAAHGCPIIHISTDYVFDGTKADPYREDDATAPAGVYGRSKLEGEKAVAQANSRHIILRTAWVYAPYGSNFLLTMLGLAKAKHTPRVVADQRGNPTYAPHLANAIIAIAEAVGADRTLPSRPWGLYHATGAGVTTWHGFATAIMAEAAALGASPVPVVPIATRDYPTLAQRPANSALDCTKLARAFGIRLPDWQQGVRECMMEIARRTPSP
jgi:dTDP-4-dehydrorhamnose reductase